MCRWTAGNDDERLKDHISANPHVFIEDIGDDIDFIVLASDGLWNLKIK